MTALSPQNQARIVISGFGLITPLGLSAWETFAALLAGRTIADRSPGLVDDAPPMDVVRALGGVALVRNAAQDPAIDLAERAAREAMYMAGVKEPGELSGILGASKGAVAALTSAFPKAPGSAGGFPVVAGDPPAKPGAEGAKAFVLGPHAYLAHHLSQRLKIQHLTSTVAACASSLTALHEARLAMLHADAAPRRMLVVTSEAALLSMFVHSYDRLGVLPPLTPNGYRGRPLDELRSGFMLAEVGAAVVLERHAPAAPSSTSTIHHPPSAITLLDTGVAAEGYDMIRPAPGMPALTRVAQQLLAERKIDVIHPHATGTADHDPAELSVYKNVLTDLRVARSAFPSLYASKGALGHTLGSSGLVSLVLACLAARTNRLPPMPWLDAPIPEAAPFLPPTLRPPSAIPTHAVFAAGFGGHVAGAVISG